MVEVYQTLPSSSTFQYCTVYCMYARSCLAHSYSQTACRNLSTNFHYANALNNLTFYITFGLASLGYLYHSSVTPCDRVGCSSSSPEQLREMLFKKVQWVPFPFQCSEKKIPANSWVVLLMVCGCWHVIYLMATWSWCSSILVCLTSNRGTLPLMELLKVLSGYTNAPQVAVNPSA